MAVETQGVVVDESRCIEDGALYLVEDRLETFKESHWPFDSGPCTALKVAEAGFYYCGTAQTPDWVRCVVCHQDMEGWEPEDNPWTEHKQNRPSCPFLKIKDPYNITVGDILELEKAAVENFIKNEAGKIEEDLKELVGDMKERLTDAAKTLKLKNQEEHV